MKPEELKAILEAVIQANQDFTSQDIIVSIVLFILVLLFVGLGLYVNKKFENIATIEDIRKIAKEEETGRHVVLRESLIRQKQWDLKREVYIGLLRSLTELRVTIIGIKKALRKNGVISDDDTQLYLEAVKKFNHFTVIRDIVLSDSSCELLKDISNQFNSIENNNA